MADIVSIIIPLYNAEKYIAEALLSIQAQSYAHWELLVVDDCSSDGSIALVEAAREHDPRINIIQLSRNSGAAVARNTGIAAASGRYIAFLDSDDVWLPGKLERQVNFLRENNRSVCFSAYKKIDEAGVDIGDVGVPSRVTYAELLKTNVIGCSTVIYDTHFFGKVEMPLIRKRQDYGLWLRLLKKVDYADGLSERLVRYRVRAGSISSNKANTSTYNWRLYRQVEGLSLLKSTYYFLHYAVRGVLRHRYPVLARKLGVLH